MSHDEMGKQTVDTTDEHRPTHEESDASEQDSALSKNEDGVDYRALYEQEKQTRLKAETKVVKLKKKQKQYREEEEDDEEEEVDIDALVSQKVQQATQQSRIDELVSQYTSNPDKQKLIKLHLETIRPSGDIKTDVRRAALIADESVFTNMTEEQKARKLSELGTSSHVSGGVDLPTVQPKKTEGEKAKQYAINNLPPRYKNLYKK